MRIREAAYIRQLAIFQIFRNPFNPVAKPNSLCIFLQFIHIKRIWLQFEPVIFRDHTDIRQPVNDGIPLNQEIPLSAASHFGNQCCQWGCIGIIKMTACVYGLKLIFEVTSKHCSIGNNKFKTFFDASLADIC